MEWIAVDGPAALAVALASLLLLFAFLHHRRQTAPPFPPGPPGLPIIGNMRMIGPLTHRGLAALSARYGGLLHFKIGQQHAFAISTAAVARDVLQGHDLAFSSRPATAAITYLTYNRADMVFAEYGPFWRQMRKLCVMKLFSRRRPETWHVVRDETDRLVRAVAEAAGTTVNVGKLIFSLTMNVTYRAAFGGHNRKEQEEFIRIMQEFSKLFRAFNIGDFIPSLGWMDPQGITARLQAARSDLDVFIDRIIDEHLARGRGPDADDADMVDTMLGFVGDKDSTTAADGSEELKGIRLTRDNIKAIIMDIMFGGTETVASAIEWAMAEMMHSPSDLARLQKEIADVVGLHRHVEESDLEKLPFLRCVVKETLRMHPPIPVINRETVEDCVVSGYSVPRHSHVMINVYAIGRDPDAWNDPDTFRPSRFADGGDAAGLDYKGGSFEFLPFGSGRRSCPGMGLGLYGLDLALARLAHGFTWELPDGMKPSELDMSDVFGLTAPRAERLRAVPTPRLSCPY